MLSTLAIVPSASIVTFAPDTIKNTPLSPGPVSPVLSHANEYVMALQPSIHNISSNALRVITPPLIISGSFSLSLYSFIKPLASEFDIVLGVSNPGMGGQHIVPG